MNLAAVIPLREQATQLDAALRLAMNDEEAGLRALDATFPALEQTSGTSALLAAAGAVTALHTGWTRFDTLPQWLTRLSQQLVNEAQLPAGWPRVRVDCAVIAAAFLGEPGRFDAQEVQQRLTRALDEVIASHAAVSLEELLLAARVLLDFIEAHNRIERFEPLMVTVEGRLPKAIGNAALARLAGRALLYAGRCYLRFNLQQRNRRYVKRASDAFARARALAQQHDLPQLAFDVAHAELFFAVTNGDQARVESLLDEMEANLRPGEPMRLAEYLMERTRVALLHDEIDTALALSADCLQAVAQSAAPTSQRGPQMLARVWALTAADRIDDALSVLREYAPATGQDTRTRQVLDCIDALLTALHVRDGDEHEYTARLRDGFGRAARLRWPNYFASLPKLAAQLTADALARGIETDFLRGVVAQRKLTAPSRHAENWPWPVQVRTFGGFALAVNGEMPRAAGGKAQRKPLELLRTLAALGRRGVAAERLADLLWPESEGAAARAALKVTVSRLRKLLGSEAAVRVEDGRLQLAQDLVHLDTDCFESVCDDIDAVGADSTAERLQALARLLTRWYRGPFLDGETPNALLLQSRQRFHTRFPRAAGLLATALAQRGHGEAAIALLEEAALIDPLDEDLHRRLLCLLRDRGEHAAALRAYHRLRASLGRALGVLPAAATVRVVADLLSEAEARSQK